MPWAAASMLMLSAACAPIISWPPVQGDAAVHDLSTIPAPSAMAAAVRAVTNRWPVRDNYLVSVPAGTSRSTANAILAKLNDPYATLPIETTLGLPAYHITRVWVRGDRATIEIFRPSSDDTTRAVSVRLRSHLGSWRVESLREWPEGAFPEPTVNGWRPQDRFGPGDATPANPVDPQLDAALEPADPTQEPSQP